MNFTPSHLIFDLCALYYFHQKANTYMLSKKKSKHIHISITHVDDYLGVPKEKYTCIRKTFP